ncbi:hypothetical protein IEQ34_003247 [Dendrobium chrysotoxum]|uniref:Uncharacterized protein n=1 Tax=Dendrobium chrysotoxum TaxID=161865 RepID=A0AAV7HKG8_DENCH|nr:hypothetical protein IEQ34_003247 [Dendrobium chrysotoxum]
MPRVFILLTRASALALLASHSSLASLLCPIILSSSSFPSKMLTICLMFGLLSAFDSVHAVPSLTILSTSFLSKLPSNLSSAISSAGRLLASIPHHLLTNSASGLRRSTAGLPHTISSTTTPKLYTSAAVVAFPVSMYSGDMYPNIPRAEELRTVDATWGPPFSLRERNSARAKQPSRGLRSGSRNTEEEVKHSRSKRLYDAVTLPPGEDGGGRGVVPVEKAATEDATRGIVVDDEHLTMFRAPAA